MSKKTQTAKADIIRSEENYTISVDMTEKEKQEVQDQINSLLRERWQAEEQINKSKLALSRIGSELKQISSNSGDGKKDIDVDVEHHIFIKAKKKETYHDGKLVATEDGLASYELQTEIGDKVLNKKGDYEDFQEEEETE